MKVAAGGGFSVRGSGRRLFGKIFIWSASDQRVWFEDYRFFVDSKATRCNVCRKQQREVLALQRKYDSIVADARSGKDLIKKKTVVGLVDQIASMTDSVPERLVETREAFLKQIRKAEQRLLPIPVVG